MNITETNKPVEMSREVSVILLEEVMEEEEFTNLEVMAKIGAVLEAIEEMLTENEEV